MNRTRTAAIKINAKFVFTAATLATVAAFAVPQAPAKPTVVIAHGAFADGFDWSEVISLLQARGIHAIAL